MRILDLPSKGPDRNTWGSLGVPFGALVLVVWVSAVAAPLTPVQTLEVYYQAVDGGDCEQALRLRPGYTMTSCKIVKHATLEHVVVSRQDASHALLSIRVKFQKADNDEETFSGSVELERRDEDWIIKTDSFKASPAGPRDGTDSSGPAPSAPRVESFSGSTPTQAPRLLHGSEYLLQRCWRPDELRASAGEEEFGWDEDPSLVPRELPANPQDWSMPVRGTDRGTIRSVHPAAGGMPLALTFNLIERAGERSGYDGELVDVLRRLEVPATFFASGTWMLRHAERARQLLADPLFELGLLGWDHHNMALLGADEVELRLLRSEAAYREVWRGLKESPCTRGPKGKAGMSLISPVPSLFRFPYGRCAATTLDQVAAFGLRAVQWSLVLDDIARDSSLDSIFVRLQMTGTGGAIVVGHGDGRERYTATALAMAIPRLRKQGYELVSISQLLTRGEPVTAMTCYEQEPGDNLSYDEHFRN